MVDQNLLEKISKLLALTSSPNEHEAALAAEKAAELLAKHNLSVADLGQDLSLIHISEPTRPY